MKKIIAFLFFTISIYGYGQNNLSFNQASIIDIPQGGTVTVPAGKVWKIESFGMDNSRVLYVPSITIDGQTFTPSQNFNGPIWVNENSVIGRGVENGQASGARKLSVLEFTVTGGSGGGGDSGNVSSEGLTFSGVLYEEFSGFNFGLGPVGTITVPSNTVYKITRTTVANTSNGYVIPSASVSFDQIGGRNIDTNPIYLGPGTYTVYISKIFAEGNAPDARFAAINGLIYTYQ